jgi:hypothetical protein
VFIKGFILYFYVLTVSVGDWDCHYSRNRQEGSNRMSFARPRVGVTTGSSSSGAPASSSSGGRNINLASSEQRARPGTLDTTGGSGMPMRRGAAGQQQRGLTPPKGRGGGSIATANFDGKALQMQQQEQGERPPGVPKLNLTVEEELEILDRLEKGDFTFEGGWAQFLPNMKKNDNDGNHNTHGKPKYQQNLLGAFNTEQQRMMEVMEDEGMTSRIVESIIIIIGVLINNDSQSQNGDSPTMGNLVSSSMLPEPDDGSSISQDCNSKSLRMTHADHIEGRFVESLQETLVLKEDEEEDGEESDSSDNDGDEDGIELPEYLKQLDKNMKSMDDYKVLMHRTVEAVFEKKFAEIFPEPESNVTEVHEPSLYMRFWN